MNCQLPIANYQLLAAAGGRFARRRKNCGQLASFLLQVDEATCGKHVAFAHQFERKLYFFSHGNFGDKLRARSGFAGGSIVRCSRISGTCNLMRQNSGFQPTRKLVRQIEDAQSKTSSFELSILQDS